MPGVRRGMGVIAPAAPILAFTGRYKALSNPYRTPVPMPDGVIYPSGENAFQAQKNADLAWRNRIASMSPLEAKAAGRVVRLRVDWEQVKKLVMLRVELNKFDRNPPLARLLASTAGQRLVEGNHWHDNFWGDCHCGNADGRHPRCLQPGLNYLGQLLEAVRLVYQPDPGIPVTK
jgi:ribA/ribD-fused uncharacterized protein